MKAWTHALAALAFLCLLAGPARADKEKAAEHFALAEKAEAREDWKAAIAEYTAAYRESPHPSVQFNIAKNYERLGNARKAAEHFRRYLDESGGAADDAADVREHIEELRRRPSKVEVIAQPAGAEVIVDGASQGTAPLTLTLAAGEHEVRVSHGGRTSLPQKVTLEYGDPITVRIDLDAKPGTLMVYADVDGAEVQLDGKVAGYTPLTGQVPAGRYQLLVSKSGYRTVQRDVDVTAGGSRQVRVSLEPIDGEDDGPEPERSSKYYFGWSLGYDSAESGTRYVVDLGWRSPGNRLEAGLLFGALGGNDGAGAGLEGRLYFATGRVRPYMRVALLAGGSRSSTNDNVTLLEGGGGVLIVGSSGEVSPRKRYAVDYFLEANVNLQLQEPAMDEGRIGVPIILGLLFRYGGE